MVSEMAAMRAAAEERSNTQLSLHRALNEDEDDAYYMNDPRVWFVILLTHCNSSDVGMPYRRLCYRPRSVDCRTVEPYLQYKNIHSINQNSQWTEDKQIWIFSKNWNLASSPVAKQQDLNSIQNFLPVGYMMTFAKHLVNMHNKLISVNYLVWYNKMTLLLFYHLQQYAPNLP